MIEYTSSWPPSYPLLTPQSFKDEKDDFVIRERKNWKSDISRRMLAIKMKELAEAYAKISRAHTEYSTNVYQSIVIHFKVLEEIFSNEGYI